MGNGIVPIPGPGSAGVGVGPRLVVELMSGGTVSVSGPLQDKILCFGLLEMARQVVHDFKPQPLAMPSPGDLAAMRMAMTQKGPGR